MSDEGTQAPSPDQPELFLSAAVPPPPPPPVWAAPITPPMPSAAPLPAGVPRRGDSSRWRGLIVGVALGALVGGGVGAGVVAVSDDGTTTTRVVTVGQQAVSRPASALTGTPLDIATLITKVEPAVVAITTGGGPGSGDGAAGTGFIISSDGYIATNNHVVVGATRIQVALTTGDLLSARIVGRDATADLAVLKVDRTGLPTVQLGDSNAVQVGDEVVAIGNALALDGGLSVTRGIISGLNRDIQTNEGGNLTGLLQTDAAINPGNSGGPLIDAEGRVIGINTAIASPSTSNAVNIGFVIPISNAKPIIDDLTSGRVPSFLGVSTQTVTPALAQQQGLQAQAGAYVAQVTAGSPAAKAGIQRGDVIIEIGGTTVTQSSDVLTAVRSHRPSDTLDIVVDRGGTSHTFHATLVERPSTNT